MSVEPAPQTGNGIQNAGCRNARGAPVAVVGVGNRMRGDDAIGGLVAGELDGSTDIVAIDAGTTPENQLDRLVALRPERVLFVDACAFGGAAGDFRLFSREEIDDLAGSIVSTHALPLGLTVALLEKELDAEVLLLGIQPGRLDFGAELSESTARALPRIVEFVREWARASA